MAPTSGCSMVSSWAPATIQMAGVREMADAHRPIESEGDSASGGVTGCASNPAPSSSSVSSYAMQRGPKVRPHLQVKGPGIKPCLNLIDRRNASRCRHLEECMFPRFLSLDGKHIDHFCMGLNVKNPGRTYIEALHLKEFLKNPKMILSDKIGHSSRASGKRGRNDETSSHPNKSLHFSSSKKIHFDSDPRVPDNGRLSQAYLGGIEGKRAWILQNRQNIHTKKYPSYDEAMDDLISSEIHMRLRDQTVSLNFDDDDNFKRLMNLVKPSPGFISPCLDSSSRDISPIEAADKIIDGNQFAMSSGTPDALSDFSSNIRDNNGNENDTHKSSSDEKIDLGPVASNANFEWALYEGKKVSLAANKLVESFRRNRKTIWANKHGNEKKAYKCAWCPASSASFDKAGTSFNFQFGVIRENIISEEDNSCMDHEESGDALIQCLECNLVGCAPNVLNRGSSDKTQHAMLHFLMSGHRLGVTCGKLGEIFCMACGDLIYHECFDQERERIFLEHNIPTLSWSETPIIRGIDPSSFFVTPENGVVWRGMMATYPTPVSGQLVEASRLAMNRMAIFRGDSCNRSINRGPAAVKLSMYQLRRTEDLLLPIGMYNLGNTCYMTATLQCLIHCKPLRDFFLHDLAHPYQSCRALRVGSNKSCLACELDKIYLECYGSGVGLDAIAALEEQLNLSSAPPADAEEEEQDTHGHPLIPSSILAESWRNRGMKYLACHAQHDAQEYFNAFIDCLATHAFAYHKYAEDMRQAVHKSQIQRSHPSHQSFYTKFDTDFIRNTFKGTLRSVLICQKCGGKRTQTESFSNVSLPLAKEFSTANVETRGIPRRGKISVEICLDHFTRPETLSDTVFCDSCNSKERTQKQQTFSKLPNVLCLHLKRFNSAASKKITDFISFPAQGLDMGKHLPHWCEQGLESQEKFIEDTGVVESPKVLFDLFATVNHRGTLNQGHYTANVKCGDRWYLCNDALITTFGDGNGEKEVLSSEDAYMLFYQKRKRT